MIHNGSLTESLMICYKFNYVIKW